MSIEIQKISPIKYLAQDGNNLYSVMLSGKDKKTISCNCFNFSHYRECAHVNEIKSLLGYSVRKVAKAKDPYAWMKPYEEDIMQTLNEIKHAGRQLGSVIPLPKRMPKWK